MTALGTIGILVGGGPAPGINGVIGAATMAAQARGARVVGILEGFKHLMRGAQEIQAHARELSRSEVVAIHLRGGSILQTSRANPTRQPGDLDRCVEALDALGVEKLVTIGGDDTASSAVEVARAAGGRMGLGRGQGLRGRGKAGFGSRGRNYADLGICPRCRASERGARDASDGSDGCAGWGGARGHSSAGL